MRPILKTYDMLGGPHTNGIQVTSEAFAKANPAITGSVLKAHEDANAFIKRDPKAAAEIYRTLSNDRRSTVDDLTAMIVDPDIDYTTTPANIMPLTKFMADTGRLKTVPGSWKDLFLPEAHHLKGS